MVYIDPADAVIAFVMFWFMFSLNIDDEAIDDEEDEDDRQA